MRVNRKDLSEELAMAAQIAQKTEAVPILRNALLQCDGGRLNISATDTACTLRTSVAAEGDDDDWSALVQASTLYEVVRRHQAEYLDLSPGERFVVSGGSATSRIACLQGTDGYPVLPVIPEMTKTPIKGLQRAIGAALCALKTQGRLHLDGVAVQRSGGEVRCCATNGHNLVVCGVSDMDASVPIEGNIVIPAHACRVIQGLDHLHPKGKSFGFDRGHVHVASGPRTISVRLLEDTPPDFDLVLGSSFPNSVDVDLSAMQVAVDLAKVTCSQVMSGGDRYKALKIGVSNGIMSVASASPDLGDSSEEIEVTTKIGRADSFEIGLNPDYLDAMFQAMRGVSDTATMHFGSAGSRVDFSAEDLTFVIMGLRI